MKSDEAFMRELQPHVERTVLKICSALKELASKQSGETTVYVTELLKSEALSAKLVMGAEGRESQEKGLRRMRILRKASAIADQIMKRCGLDSVEKGHLHKRLREEVEGFYHALFVLWEADGGKISPVSPQRS